MVPALPRPPPFCHDLNHRRPKATAGTVGSVAIDGMLVGAILAGRLSDSLGRKRAVIGCAIVFSIFTIACAAAPNAPQCLIIAAVAGHYPDHLRGTALGWALGIDRVGAVAALQVGGWLLAAGLGVNSNFIAFALAAGVGAVLIAVAWRLAGSRGPSPTPVIAH